MKRQGSSTSGQPPHKKSDPSTDLRSKIGAKLQTLLNGIDTDALLSAKRRKQLYEDLFGKPKYSEIVIDPTVVIKIEPDDEECNNDSSTLHNSQNFLSSTKNRLSELLTKQDGTNKYKDSGKENTLVCNKNKSTSNKSNSLQNPSNSKSPSHSYNSLSKKRISNNKAHINTSTDFTNHDVPIKNLVVVLEDFMKSPCKTKLSPTKHPVCDKNLANLELNEQLDSLSNLTNKRTDFTADLCSDESSKSYVNSENSVSECSFIEENSESYSPNFFSPNSILSDNPSPSEIMEHIDVYSNTGECMSHVSYYSEEESEMIDDPLIPQVIVDIKVGEALTTGENDSEVELLCVKKPTTEVITLEDNDDEVVAGTEVPGNKMNYVAAVWPRRCIHECKQCGKSFRAESLLNFHIRMHGNNLSQTPSSSSHSFS